MDCSNCETLSDQKEYFKSIIKSNSGFTFHLTRQPFKKQNDLMNFMYHCSKSNDGCRSKCSILFDTKANLADIYANNDEHNHIDDE